MEMRFATEEDAPALLEIYGQYIDTPITFETELPSLEDFRWRIREFSRDYPYLVSVQDGRITGYAYAHKAFTRDAYRSASIQARGRCFMRSFWTISSA